MQNLDIVLKCVQAVLIYLIEGGSSKIKWYLEKIQLVISSEIRYKVRQGMLLFSNYVYKIRYMFAGLPTRPLVF